MISATQLLILADIVPASLVVTAKGKVLIPPHKLSDKQRENISSLVTHHLHTLVTRVEKCKPGFKLKINLLIFCPISGRFKKLLTYNYSEKKEEKQNQLDQIFKAAMPLLVPTTTRVDEETVKVTLPNIKFFPDGEEDKTYLMVTAPDGTKRKLQVWTELTQKKLKLVYLGVDYSLDL